MNKFRIYLVLRVLLIFILGFLGLYFSLLTKHWLVSLWLLIFSFIAIAELIHFLEQSKRDLATFLMAIKQRDFSNSYKGKSKSEADNQLYSAFNLINEEFQTLRKQKETNYHFLQAVVEHSGIPMIGFKVKNEDISLMNQAAKDLFDKPLLTNLKSLAQLDKSLADILENLKVVKRN